LWDAASPHGGLQTKRHRNGRLPVCRPERLLSVDAGAQHGEFLLEERIEPAMPDMPTGNLIFAEASKSRKTV
jgi:hypothetical protein